MENKSITAKAAASTVLGMRLPAMALTCRWERDVESLALER
jgi:hypothetical protein